MFALFGSHDEDLAGEAVAEGVVFYALFGFRGGRAFFAFALQDAEDGSLVLEVGDVGRDFCGFGGYCIHAWNLAGGVGAEWSEIL